MGGRTGMAQETLRIFQEGRYRSPSGRDVDVRAVTERAIAGTVLYRPDAFRTPVEPPAVHASTMRVEVTAETTGDAGRRLVQRERVPRVVALNFASAKNPGGGFLGGAKAQEEDLARCSALYPCLVAHPEFYARNRESGSMLYTDHLLYSPDVPFVRGDDGALLEEPFLLSIVTSPAPNAGEAERHGAGESARVAETLARRAGHVLTVAALRGHDCLLLGAWGCGVFGNDPVVVADVFATLLEGPFARAFTRVVFAVYGRADDNRRAFEARFAG